jgi:threonylcarbamoyladenosine tRNA methylthiotransferase MtaB
MNQYQKVAFYTLGCKLNFSETSTIARQLSDAGFGKVEFHESADIYVVNTCSVTENADKKCKQLVKKALIYNPKAFVVIIGCYAQLKPEEIAAIPGVDLVLGAQEKFNLTQYLDNIEKKEETHIENNSIKETKDFIPGFSMGDRTRTFMKIQDGCDYFCSFCTIPLARGKSRNASITKTVIEAKKIAQTNVKEVVLTGVNIGDFGQGGEENFFELIKQLDNVEGIERFRISSIEPNLLSEEIIEFVSKSKKFVPHFHIPMQSGSDVLLKVMRRKYDRTLYRSRIEKIKAIMPTCCIGVDVIVGFPGETDEIFEETYQFLTDLDISYLHVFTYSERVKTTAIKMTDVVPMDIRKERSKRLRILSEKKKRAFYQKNEQHTEEVLFEADQEHGIMNGFTSNYIKVKTAYNPLIVNHIAPVKMTEVDRDGLMKIEFIEKRQLTELKQLTN